MKYDAQTDGRLQVAAGVRLLEGSRLVLWGRDVGFQPVLREALESSWRKDLDPVFGRLACWITFSAGAEFLAKGVCLLNNVDIRREWKVPAHPSALTYPNELKQWVIQFRANTAPMTPVTNFGTLNDLTRGSAHPKAPEGIRPPGALTRLCFKVNATDEQRELTLAAYTLLARTIRNRDAHAYVPNVRNDHFSLVPDLFARTFDLLVSWVRPDGAETVDDWLKGAEDFIRGI